MELYNKLTFPQGAQIFESFLPKNVELPRTSPPYPASIFPEMSKKVISMVTRLLGYYTDQWVDEIVLGFLSTFAVCKQPSLLFNYSQFLANEIHEQLVNYKVEGVFKYQSFLVYLMLYYQEDKFKFPLQKTDSEGNPWSVIHWTSLVRNNSEEYSYTDFIDKLLYISLCLLRSDVIPRIYPDIRKFLHLSEQAKVGDWYLYQNYTEIRVYGSKLPPYRLPIFVPIRIFSLEYSRQMLNMDEVHFVSYKKKAQFKLKAHIGPYIMNTKVAAK